ncbi:hypothetical protein [Rhodococcus tibetensis]|uniref:Uncharacterized protein n=1 Tax=Rhodococcus tibetensis TaxID=2965064 RepID=A0ABT1QHU7_9NOCA|nr:hypothetical protein [Rhodococcus sp. FXJ9.536]MCQ4121868.1 hypothetical protein [Rhodococcus sp. FXJ9.536]
MPGVGEGGDDNTGYIRIHLRGGRIHPQVLEAEEYVDGKIEFSEPVIERLGTQIRVDRAVLADKRGPAGVA